LGVYEQLGMSLTMKMLVRDNQLSLGQWALKELGVERVILAHDQIVEGDVKQRLARAFRWLGAA